MTLSPSLTDLAQIKTSPAEDRHAAYSPAGRAQSIFFGVPNFILVIQEKIALPSPHGQRFPLSHVVSPFIWSLGNYICEHKHFFDLVIVLYISCMDKGSTACAAWAAHADPASSDLHSCYQSPFPCTFQCLYCTCLCYTSIMCAARMEFWVPDQDFSPVFGSLQGKCMIARLRS